MKVNAHAERALVALTQRMPVPASVVINRLRSEPTCSGSKAIEVCRMTMSVGDRRVASNGDSVVVIVRSGAAVTAMLRRSWNQPFTPEALRVDQVEVWT